MTDDYHIQIRAPGHPEHFAKLVDSLEVGDEIVWNGRTEPFTVTEIPIDTGLDIGDFQKVLIVENQSRENGAEFRLRFEDAKERDHIPILDDRDARCVVQRQIGERGNSGGWGRCTDVESITHVNPVEAAERSGREVATDGSGHSCDACGETFGTLTRLRLHEQDDCPQRETFDRLDPDAPDVGLQTAEGLLTCRDCGRENPNVDFEQTADFADGNYHLIVEFGCRHCGSENENRAVMTGVDRESLKNLPPHLRPSEGGEQP